MADDLTLYEYDDSVCSQKVRLCLSEKGLIWDRINVDLMRHENLEPWFLEINPAGVVPVLVHNHRVIPESSQIMAYVDETFGGTALTPLDPDERSRMDEWIRIQDETLMRAVGAHSTQQFIRPHVRREPDERLDWIYQTMIAAKTGPLPARAEIRLSIGKGGDVPAERLDRAEAQMKACIDRMEESLTLSPWLAGNTYSLADAAWTPFVHRMAALGMEHFWNDAAHSHFIVWWARIRARPSYHAAILCYPTFAHGITYKDGELIAELAT